MTDGDVKNTVQNESEGTNHDAAMEALFKALEESGQLEEFLENQRRIQEAAQAAVLGMHSDPATAEGRAAIERAADAGDCTCQLKMGIIFGDGELVPPNYQKSLYYFKKAADENQNATGQFYTGLYLAGMIDSSIPANLGLAVDYLKLAAKGADADIARDAEDALNKIYQFRLQQREAQQQSQQQAQQNKGCYIATAVYGSYDCPQVWVLRRFRDQVLAESLPGRIFIRCYYAVSPVLVRWFGKNPVFTSFWKKRLDDLVSRLESRGFQNNRYQD